MTAAATRTLIALLAAAWLIGDAFAAPAFAEGAPRPAASRPHALRRAGARVRKLARHLRLPPRVASKIRRAIRRPTRLVGSRLTAIADGLSAKLPPKTRRVFEKARLANPLTVVGFGLKKFRQDPVFLGTYGAASFWFSNLQVPLLIGLGFNPMAAVGIRLATGIPLDISVVAWRQHQKRPDRTQTFRDSMRSLKGELVDYAARRRHDNRRVHQRRVSQRAKRAPATP